jgi:hypothetical protein
MAPCRAIQFGNVTGHSRHVSRTGSHGAKFACAAAPSEMRPSSDTAAGEVHLRADQLAQWRGMPQPVRGVGLGRIERRVPLAGASQTCGQDALLLGGVEIAGHAACARPRVPEAGAKPE